MSRYQESIMLATLGGQPQLITFALDDLLNRGEKIARVILLYPSADRDRVSRALEKLKREFVNQQYRGHPCVLELRPILDDSGLDEPDIRAEPHAHATWEKLRDLISQLKREQHQLHICVSGGRRMMALLIMSVALLHLTYRDKLWHIYTPQEFIVRARDGAIMHAWPDDGVRLIQVPLVPLGTHFPALRELAQTMAAPTPTPYLAESQRARCQIVVSNLTPRELETLQLFAEGLIPQEVANSMGITLNTVNTYRKKIFDLCRNVWPEQETIRYHHLRDWFGPYFAA